MSFQKIKKEEEYIFEQEQKKLKKLREEKEKEEKIKKFEEIKKTCYMRCPKCCGDLYEMEYEKILIDVCSQCGGIWLDKGELEQLLCQHEGFLTRFFNRFRKSD